MTLQKVQAIQTALGGKWDTAISLNQELLKQNPQDIDALNRLAFAYTIMGKLKEAKSTHQKVLKIDNLNPIALKNLKKLSDGTTAKISYPHAITSNLFLEEPGKTKIVTLLNTAPARTIQKLQIGQTLTLSVKRLKVFVLNDEKQFVGMLPDNIGMRLIKFLKGGNVYEAYTKSADAHGVTIFIKEVKRIAKFKNQPSFVSTEHNNFSFSKSAKNKTQEDSEEEGA